MRGLLNKLLGDGGDREVARLRPVVDTINGLENEFEALSDEQLREQVAAWRAHVHEVMADVPDDARKAALRQTLDDLLPQVFAAVREASRRTIGLRQFDVQLIGGAILHRGKIAEMRTGEGKTLVAAAPVALNALSGRGAHLITVNDYLSRRDAGWMGPIYHLLGLSVAAIGHDFSGLYDPTYNDPKPHHDDRLNHFRPVTRREAYAADITYGTNNEFGFDYLRDNMALRLEDLTQRGLYYAIVDEVDFILIDEARTPLIISGMVEGDVQRYERFARLVPRLQAGTAYTVDEKLKNAILTDDGVARLEKALGVDNLSDPEHGDLMHHLHQALRAWACYKKDVDYVVKDGQVIIVDEFTGRLMFGRRYSDGLHQAIEAKEGVKVERETQTLATITFQNYFRMYEKLAGMTGTAKTEEEELSKIYNLPVVVIPTHRAMVRKDHSDFIYKSEKGKWKAVVDEIVEWHKQGRPMLVGTRSIEKNEYLSELLRRRGVKHEVLNAKQHEREAEIIAQAGRVGAVTIATNMAGRGVDIILGGNPPDAVEAEKVRVLGGLHVIGTERHEARRIDNQLRGRSGRQGDPGSSRFYIGLDDELMRIFAGERIAGIMDRFGLDEDTPIEHNIVTRQIEGAQKKVEQYHFDMRKHVLEYDDVMNVQRKVIYAERRKVLEAQGLRESVLDMITRLVKHHVDEACPRQVPQDEWDLEGLIEVLAQIAPAISDVSIETLHRRSADDVADILAATALQAYEEKESEVGAEVLREVERLVLLQTIDRKWIDHLHNMDALREGIGLRAYAQTSPLIEYQREGYDMFQVTLHAIQDEAIRTLFRVRITAEDGSVPRPQPKPVARPLAQVRETAGVGAGGGGAAGSSAGAGGARSAGPVNTGPKLGRNDPCWCGSGKKYKKCHGREA
jgi:preprotein translocase subunit SecA